MSTENNYQGIVIISEKSLGPVAVFYRGVQKQDFQKQTQEAIAKRDISSCPVVNSPFDGLITDTNCVSAIKNLTTLDTFNALVIRAIKEKNEKLCDSAGKDSKEVCVKAVKDAISGILIKL